ncbi:IS30 family transposase [Streptomyces sp. ISL-94]|uniref:IS30 family transposase n=1 Tax=Streptomyces sp. ISL-94 TaxID=2819190 RepID=UPI001BE85473|nr:IS30 family transposase [Streptomyces sp. ISL-94]MBT2478981.1 IS30 family transposase [Streptomyces sp. ISL-94]
MTKYAPNKLPTTVKKRYFELLREGHKGAAAARVVGVSTSCGSLWFIDAGSMIVPDHGPISPRFLTQDDRIAIADGLQTQQSAKEIAASVGTSFQTVYREIKRNSKPDGRYNPWWAHNQALLRRQRPKEEKIRAGAELRTLIREKLTEKWSPPQIARFLARAHAGDPAMRACSETIYRALFAGLLGRKPGKLRTGRTRRKKQRRGVPSPNKIKNMTLIHQRPAEVNDRKIPGHWEGDLIIGRGQGSAIGTLVERTTRYVQLIHLPHGWKAPQVRNAIAAQTAHLPSQIRKTLTWDQGRELTLHQDIETLTGFRIYFCDPHSPWQRGTNENTNGLLRQYFPKGTDLSVHTARDLRDVARELNRRPRLVLGDKTPAEAMKEWLTQPLTC